MINKKVITLNEFIIEEQKGFPYATGELSSLLRDIVFAAKLVNREVNKAGLVDILGTTGSSNASGEEVKKLDVFAHEQFVNSLRTSGECCGVASEESQDFLSFDNERAKNAKYVVCIDPLDGSSNIDVNVSIGTIFSILERKSVSGPCVLEDFLQSGFRQVAAGYVVYGAATLLVYTTGDGVNGFTLDPSIGEFCLSHPNIKIPEKGKIYSINESYRARFADSVNEFVDYCKVEDKASNRPYSCRYIGSMVADFHRNLLKGGIFMYPAMSTHPNGKLRLLYECNPMAFIIEQAGGLATSGEQRIMEITPHKLHQRTPIFIGSKEMVYKVVEYINQEKLVGSVNGVEH